MVSRCSLATEARQEATLPLWGTDSLLQREDTTFILSKRFKQQSSPTRANAVDPTD